MSRLRHWWIAFVFRYPHLVPMIDVSRPPAGGIEIRAAWLGSSLNVLVQVER